MNDNDKEKCGFEKLTIDTIIESTLGVIFAEGALNYYMDIYRDKEADTLVKIDKSDINAIIAWRIEE